MGIPNLIYRHDRSDLDCTVFTEEILHLTSWEIREPKHTFVVHLSGQIDHLETEMYGRGAFYDPVAPGDVTAIPAGCDYQTMAQGGAISYAVLETPTVWQDDSSDRTWEIEPSICRFDGRLLELIRQLPRHAGDTLAEDELVLRIQNHLRQHFHTGPLASRPGLNSKPPGLSTVQKRTLRSFINDQLENKVKLADLAALVSMRPNQLLIAFRASFGTTPAQYLLEYRLRRARRLLRETRQDLLTVALEAGFGSHSHFTNHFVTRFGVPPSYFRRLAPELP
jgi:AraC family transcriptional regulator